MRAVSSSLHNDCCKNTQSDSEFSILFLSPKYTHTQVYIRKPNAISYPSITPQPPPKNSAPLPFPGSARRRAPAWWIASWSRPQSPHAPAAPWSDPCQTDRHGIVRTTLNPICTNQDQNPPRTNLVAESMATPVPVAPPPTTSTSYGLLAVPWLRLAHCSSREGTRSDKTGTGSFTEA